MRFFTSKEQWLEATKRQPKLIMMLIGSMKQLFLNQLYEGTGND